MFEPVNIAKIKTQSASKLLSSEIVLLVKKVVLRDTKSREVILVSALKENRVRSCFLCSVARLKFARLIIASSWGHDVNTALIVVSRPFVGCT